MIDNRFKEYENCSILSVYKRERANIKDSGEYLIQISRTCNSDYVDIKITKHNLYDDLKKLMNNEVERVYLSHYMADIDIFKSPKNNKYCIKWSPHESSFNYMYFEEKNFVQDFVNALKPNEEKQY